MSPYNYTLTWSLTYPHNDTPPAVLLHALSAIDIIVQYVIAREHSDGNNHLHAYIKFATGVKLRDAPDTFNVIDKLGKYKPCRSPKDIIKYCTQVGNFITSFDFLHYFNKQGKDAKKVGESKYSVPALPFLTFFWTRFAKKISYAQQSKVA